MFLYSASSIEEDGFLCHSFHFLMCKLCFLMEFHFPIVGATTIDSRHSTESFHESNYVLLYIESWIFV